MKLVGGQAVIEGVMMRCRNKVAIATRGSGITVKTQSFYQLKDRWKFFGWPFIRGTVELIEMTVLGIRSLTYSADKYQGDEEPMSSWAVFGTVLFSFAFAMALFVALPLYLTKLITSSHGVLFNLIDGVLRVGLFIGYLLLISLMKDIRRVFQYHGAEHKAITCYEKKLALNVKNARLQSRLHPRCGTTFIIIVLVISIFVFSLITSPLWFIKLLSRIVLLPVIAGISYEVLKFAAKRQDNLFWRSAITPGFWVQGLTTREPSGKQLEVALAALKKVV